MTAHRTATRDQWRAERIELLEAEKALTRRSDELARRRRELPWVEVDKPYRFDTVAGPKSLDELFGDRSQLLVVHFMFDPGWDEGCPSCSLGADAYNGQVPHLEQRDVRFVVISRAPLEKLQAYRERMGWDFEWVSSYGSDFNVDFGVTFTPGDGREYNYAPAGMWEQAGEAPGISAFAREDGTVYHTYSSFARDGEATMLPFYAMLDRLPRGRHEDDLPFPMAWVRRHDEYARATA